jgi:hypothetical protein
MHLRARANHVFPCSSSSRSEGVACGIVLTWGNSKLYLREYTHVSFAYLRCLCSWEPEKTMVFPYFRPFRSEGVVCGIVFDKKAQLGSLRGVYTCHFCVPGCQCTWEPEQTLVFTSSSLSHPEVRGGWVKHRICHGGTVRNAWVQTFMWLLGSIKTIYFSLFIKKAWRLPQPQRVFVDELRKIK